MNNVVRERKKDLQMEKRQIHLTYDSVKYFKAKKAQDASSLDTVIDAKSTIGSDLTSVNLPVWNTPACNFDDEKYLRGEY